MYTPDAERYSTSGFGAPAAQPRTENPPPYFDEGGFDTSFETTEPTTIFDSPAYDGLTEETQPERERAGGWHAGLDLGLLVLRVVLGALFIAHGLQKLFGWFQGDGINGAVKLVEGFGFHSHTTVLAWVTGLTELVGGTLIALGLFTPAGAAAILGLMGSAIWVKFNGHDFAGRVELEAIYGAAAFALLFTGPGRVSLDRPTPWYRHTSAFGVAFLLIAAGAMITILVVFR